MNRTLIAVVVAAAMALMTVPGQAAAHTSSATDLNEGAYDNVWEVFGPGGLTDNPTVKQALSTVGLNAEPTGGYKMQDVSDDFACSHHDDGQPGGEDPVNNLCDDGDAHVPKAFQCRGPDPDGLDDPTDQADINIYSNKTYVHSSLKNGIFESTGSFFTPFEFGGEDADHVEEVWFGFLTTFPWPVSSAGCQWPFPVTGANYEFYRGDTNGDNGWEIPINTLLVPDAPYGFVIRVLDENKNTLAATFGYSNVNNHLDDTRYTPSSPGTCETDPGCSFDEFHDTTPPRGMVYAASVEERVDTNPSNDQIECNNGAAFGGDICVDAEPGDGVVEDVSCDRGIAMEYGEPLAKVEVDGASSFFFNPPDRDVDSAPAITTTRDDWGPGICIPNPVGDVSIKAWDMEGNIRKQVLQ